MTSTLDSADSDTRNASQIFGDAAVSAGKPAALDNMTDWAPGQIAALDDVVARIPAGALHNRAVSSLHLVEAAEARATALKPVVGCTCMAGARSDALGPIPCTTCGAPASSGTPGPTSGATAPGAPRSTGGPTPNGAGSTTGPSPNGKPGATGSTGLPTGGVTPPPTGLPTGLPTLPLPTSLPTLPLPTSGLPHLPLPTSTSPTPTCSGLLGVLGSLLHGCKS